MQTDSLTALEQKIQQDSSLSPERQAELLKLVAALKTELETLARTNSSQAASLTRLTEYSTAPENLERRRHSRPVIADMAHSIEELEAEHPKLVSLINSLCQMLSNSGI